MISRQALTHNVSDDERRCRAPARALPLDTPTPRCARVNALRYRCDQGALRMLTNDSPPGRVMPETSDAQDGVFATMVHDLRVCWGSSPGARRAHGKVLDSRTLRSTTESRHRGPGRASARRLQITSPSPRSAPDGRPCDARHRAGPRAGGVWPTPSGGEREAWSWPLRPGHTGAEPERQRRAATRLSGQMPEASAVSSCCPARVSKSFAGPPDPGARRDHERLPPPRSLHHPCACLIAPAATAWRST